ncbi:sulfotransferase family protein [Nocardioides sp. LMS-CY]|uniref:sulfotransferase family 2 domain-containing protein n=1 Tax=Nocardioides sp. (strain LMS-CY) TaxID=2840457 RepID=UPI001C003E2C|nr:sulfotransferase family 2 domain-containing protein [Nocardioides sp. LMS-CY]QWF24306.1 sulfotransferase family protein [Nocardioides sp. LMS-CY]
MVISDAHRFLFVHVQKTGGSTIDHRLGEVLPDARAVDGLKRHATLGGILRAEPGLRSYWTVGFVRNPFARLVSWYRMVDRFRERAEREPDWADRFGRKSPFIRSVARDYADLETFVLTGSEERVQLRTPQLRYLSTRTRRADLIGRQETLEADVRAMFARLDLPWQGLESKNVDQDRPDYRELFTDQMRRRVEEVFAPDLAAFDYSF